jgi:hypothetical protein
MTGKAWPAYFAKINASNGFASALQDQLTEYEDDIFVDSNSCVKISDITKGKTFPIRKLHELLTRNFQMESRPSLFRTRATSSQFTKRCHALEQGSCEYPKIHFSDQNGVSETACSSIESDNTISPLNISSSLTETIFETYSIRPDFLRILLSFGDEPHIAEARSSNHAQTILSNDDCKCKLPLQGAEGATLLIGTTRRRHVQTQLRRDEWSGTQKQLV